jgi:hypothetical protein
MAAIQQAVQKPDVADEKLTDYNEWFAKVNKITMKKIADFEGVDEKELDFDISDLPDQLYRISFDNGMSAEKMSNIVFEDFKKDYGYF